MTSLCQIEIRAPYLLFIGDTSERAYAKTALGIVQWSKDAVAGQLRLPGNTLDLGVPDQSIAEAVDAGVKSLIIGVAPVGGVVGPQWIENLVKAAAMGLDIVSGLHIPLESFSDVVTAAGESGARLVNVRQPPTDLPVASGKKRSGKRILTVGTDCAVGKKYSALALTQALLNKGHSAEFCATGQTGIMIAGKGIPIDAVVSDFVAGAAELVSPPSDKNHWAVIEGQGSLFHPAYAGVSLGLLHGSQADAIVLCHDPSRDHLLGWPDFPVPMVKTCIERNLAMGSVTNEAIRCVGVCVNTSSIEQPKRQAYLHDLCQQTALPCVDPLVDSLDPLIEQLT